MRSASSTIDADLKAPGSPKFRTLKRLIAKLKDLPITYNEYSAQNHSLHRLSVLLKQNFRIPR